MEHSLDVCNLDSVLSLAKQKFGAIVSVAASADANVLEACVAAARMGIARFILVGDAVKTVKIATNHGLSLCNFEVVDEPCDVAASELAVKFVVEGRATSLMKGRADTSVVMRAAMGAKGIRGSGKLSHIAAFDLKNYHKLLFVTDAAINIAPQLDDKIEIVKNATAALHKLGIACPKVALLAAKEKVDTKMPVTQDWAKIVELHASGNFPDCEIDGPLALDNAISYEACNIKGIGGPVAGDADLLVAPNIETGNVLYKALAFLAGARCGGVVIGAKAPIILTSRADSIDTKLISIALSVLF